MTQNNNPYPFYIEIVDRNRDYEVIETIYGYSSRFDATGAALIICNENYPGQANVVYRIRRRDNVPVDGE